MKNIDTQVKGDKLVIKVDLTQPGSPSKSGKSIIIASSEGNKPIPGAEQFKIGLNVYTLNKEGK